MKRYIKIVFTLVLFLSACKKDWLDIKPNKSLVVPSTTADYQALLDNTNLFNANNLGVAEIATDDYFTTYTIWKGRPAIEQDIYIWNSDPYSGNSLSDWSQSYTRILQANIVLDGISKINKIDANYNNVKGTALFYRAYDFFALSQQFCKHFSAKSASTDLGIPLRLTANINDKSVRATIAETYSQIVGDLKTCRNLLPQNPLYKTRPSIPAVYAMLSRVYLAMDDYTNAGLYADSCLQIYNKLVDFNTLNTRAAWPFSKFNDEVILDWQLGTYNIVRTGIIVPELYQSYHINDLRLQAYYTDVQTFKGSYDGSALLFNGLATDEIYLNRAECRARANNVVGAMSDLNILMAKRWNKNVTYPSFSALDATDALMQILTERRKELIFRGLRWSDLRRLNNDPRFAKTLTRQLNGVTYSLPPNDLRYVFLIPRNEIVASNIIQNPR